MRKILDQEQRHIASDRPHVRNRSGLEFSDLAPGELGFDAQPDPPTSVLRAGLHGLAFCFPGSHGSPRSVAALILSKSRGLRRRILRIGHNRTPSDGIEHCASVCERVAMLFYSLIESAKRCGVEPRAFLREATLRAVRNPGTVTLPRDLKQQYTRSPRLF